MLMQNSDSHFISIAHSFKYLGCFDIGFIEIRGTNHKLRSGGVVYIFVNKSLLIRIYDIVLHNNNNIAIYRFVFLGMSSRLIYLLY